MKSCFEVAPYSDDSSLSGFLSWSGVIVENYFAELLLISPIIFYALVDYYFTYSTLFDGFEL